MTTELLGLCGLFGIVCGLYVSVVGFALTAIAAVAVLGVVSAIAGGLFGGWVLALAFVAMQVGYFLCVVGGALVAHGRRLALKDPRRTASDLHINHE